VNQQLQSDDIYPSVGSALYLGTLQAAILKKDPCRLDFENNEPDGRYFSGHTRLALQRISLATRVSSSCIGLLE